jgi:hypothetical protein
LESDVLALLLTPIRWRLCSVVVVATATHCELQIQPRRDLMPRDFFARWNTLICVMD